MYVYNETEIKSKRDIDLYIYIYIYIKIQIIIIIHKKFYYVVVDCKKLRILFNNSAFTSSGTVDLPCGVTSATNSSTVTFSKPFLLITSLQYSFNSSLHPHDVNLSFNNSFNLSFSPMKFINILE